MFAVVFEVLPSASGYQRYLDIAAALRPKLEAIDGFLSVERFRSVHQPGWILSLSLWRDHAALVQWRGHGEHHAAQGEGRQSIFDDYRIRVVHMGASAEVPAPDGRPLLGLQEYASIDSGGKLYQSLTDATKHVALYDLSEEDTVRAWQAHTATPTAAPARALCGAVLRDYGLFERQQAPQRFPEKQRQR